MQLALRTFAAAAVVALTTIAPYPVHAQSADTLAIGARLRIQLRAVPPAPTPARITGVLSRADSTTLWLATTDGAPLRTVGRIDIVRLEQYAGRRSAGASFGKGAAYGALAGVGLSGALVIAAAIDERRHPCGGCMISGPVAAVIVAVPLTAASTLVGGLVGLGFGRRDRWTRVERP